MDFFIPKTANNTILVSLVAILTALTTVATIIIAIPFPTSTGFLNFGDALVMLSGMLLGPVGGFFAGGVGSALGDVVLGYYHFAPITLVAKGFEGMMVGLISYHIKMPKRLKIMDVVSLIAASIIMLSGYFIAEIFLFGFEAALAELITLNLIQVISGSIIAAIVGPPIRGFLRNYLFAYESHELLLDEDVDSISTPEV